MHEQRAREDQVTNLEQVRTLAHYHIDGIEGPSLRSESRRRMFLEEMERVCNEQFRPGGVIKISSELESFIKFADGVVNLDFRYSGVCPFSLFSDEIGNEDIDEQTARGWILSDFCLLENTFNALADIGLEVRGGFETGMATREDD